MEAVSGSGDGSGPIAVGACCWRIGVACDGCAQPWKGGIFVGEHAAGGGAVYFGRCRFSPEWQGVSTSTFVSYGFWFLTGRTLCHEHLEGNHDAARGLDRRNCLVRALDSVFYVDRKACEFHQLSPGKLDESQRTDDRTRERHSVRLLRHGSDAAGCRL